MSIGMSEAMIVREYIYGTLDWMEPFFHFPSGEDVIEQLGEVPKISTYVGN